MGSEKEFLQKQYDLAIGQTDTWYFFLNLADYVKFIKGEAMLKEIVEPLELEKRNLIEELDKTEAKAVKELKASKAKLEKLIGKVEGLRDAIRKEGVFADGLTTIDQYLKKELWTSGLVSDVLVRYLHEVSWDLNEKGHGSLLDDFAVRSTDIGGGIKERILSFSKTFDERRELSKNLDHQRAVNPWGYWDFLSLLAIETMFDEPNWDASSIPAVDESLNTEYFLVKEEIIKNKKTDVFGRDSTYKPQYRDSKVDTYKHYLSRMHLYILKELARNSGNRAHGGTVGFNPATSRLDVSGTSIVIRRFSEQYHALRVIFENKEELAKEWFFSEIGEKMDREKDYTDKQLHNYFSAIRRRVAADTGIKDLFLTTNQSVTLNSDYLNSKI